MPPHLHPRSAATSTLFAGTLVASFVVVAVPHIWPCPRPRKAYMDSEIVYDADGRPMKRVRRVKPSTPENNSDPIRLKDEAHLVAPNVNLSEGAIVKTKLQEEAETLQKLQAEVAAKEEANARRECPVPKPKGVIGRLMGFEGTSDKTEAR